MVFPITSGKLRFPEGDGLPTVSQEELGHPNSISYNGSSVVSSPSILSSRPFYQTPFTGLPNPGHSDRDTNEVNESLGRKIFFPL